MVLDIKRCRGAGHGTFDAVKHDLHVLKLLGAGLPEVEESQYACGVCIIINNNWNWISRTALEESRKYVTLL